MCTFVPSIADIGYASHSGLDWPLSGKFCVSNSESCVTTVGPVEVFVILDRRVVVLFICLLLPLTSQAFSFDTLNFSPCWLVCQHLRAIHLSHGKQCSTVDQRVKGVFPSNLAMYHTAQGYIPCSGEWDWLFQGQPSGSLYSLGRSGSGRSLGKLVLNGLPCSSIVLFQFPILPVGILDHNMSGNAWLSSVWLGTVAGSPPPIGEAIHLATGRINFFSEMKHL